MARGGRKGLKTQPGEDPLRRSDRQKKAREKEDHNYWPNSKNHTKRSGKGDSKRRGGEDDCRRRENSNYTDEYGTRQEKVGRTEKPSTKVGKGSHLHQPGKKGTRGIAGDIESFGKMRNRRDGAGKHVDDYWAGLYVGQFQMKRHKRGKGGRLDQEAGSERQKPTGD